jgi:hypothetical protein
VTQGGDQLGGNVLQQDQARLQGDAHEARHDHEQGRDIHQVQPGKRHGYPRVLALHAMRDKSCLTQINYSTYVRHVTGMVRIT